MSCCASFFPFCFFLPYPLPSIPISLSFFAYFASARLTSCFYAQFNKICCGALYTLWGNSATVSGRVVFLVFPCPFVLQCSAMHFNILQCTSMYITYCDDPRLWLFCDCLSFPAVHGMTRLP
ncbi:unnamed protein product [Discosporangium mesarthrocarpum]